MRNLCMLTTAALIAALVSGQAAAINMERVNSLLEGACVKASEIAASPNFRAQLQELDNEKVARSPLDEVLSRFIARMARKYSAEGVGPSPAVTRECMRANMEVKMDIVMMDDPKFHRDIARRD